MADVQGLLADPQFQGLDPATQKQVLGKIDSSFSSLTDQQLNDFKAKVAPPPGLIQRAKNYFSGLPNIMNIMPEGIKGADGVWRQPQGGFSPAEEFALGGMIPGESAPRGATVAGQAVKNLFNNPSGLESEAEAGGKLAKGIAKVKDAYRRANIGTPDPELAARNAARNPARIDPVAQPIPDATSISGKLPSGRQVGPAAPPAPAPPVARPPAARFDVAPQTISYATPIPPPEGKLPSGRKPGGIVNQKPIAPPVAAPVAAVAPTTEELSTAKNLGGDFTKMTPQQQQFVRDAIAKSKAPASAPKAASPAKAPEVSMQHYEQTGQSFGTRMAQDATIKDRTIIDHLTSRGITPEQFEAAPPAVRNDWLRDVNAAKGKSYEYYRGEQGNNSATRLLKTWRYLKGPAPPQ